METVYCYAKEIPQTGRNVFKEELIKNATLYVPEELIANYQIEEPWCYFGKILTLSGEEVDDNIENVNTNLNCIVKWNGSSSSSTSPWGSSYSRGVDLTIYNYSNVNIIITKIEGFIDNTSIGEIPDIDNNKVLAGENTTISFAISNTKSMPEVLPWLKIYYKIGSKEFVKDSREEGSTSIEFIKSSILDSDIFYDLHGRRAEQPTKGIYIKNGKKYLVK